MPIPDDGGLYLVNRGPTPTSGRPTIALGLLINPPSVKYHYAEHTAEVTELFGDPDGQPSATLTAWGKYLQSAKDYTHWTGYDAQMWLKETLSKAPKDVLESGQPKEQYEQIIDEAAQFVLSTMLSTYRFVLRSHLESFDVFGYRYEDFSSIPSSKNMWSPHRGRPWSLPGDIKFDYANHNAILEDTERTRDLLASKPPKPDSEDERKIDKPPSH